MDVAFLVVEHGAALDALLGDAPGRRGSTPSGTAGGVVSTASSRALSTPRGVAVGHVDQVRQRVVVDLDVQLAVAALRVGQRLPRDREEVVLGQRLELEDAAAADQRLVDLEVGVLGGGADQDDRAVLDPRQQRVLLRLVEAVHLVHEEDGALAVLAAALLAPSAMASRMSLTPASTALMAMKWARVVLAMMRARVVLPVPGGP